MLKTFAILFSVLMVLTMCSFAGAAEELPKLSIENLHPKMPEDQREILKWLAGGPPMAYDGLFYSDSRVELWVRMASVEIDTTPHRHFKLHYNVYIVSCWWVRDLETGEAYIAYGIAFDFQEHRYLNAGYWQQIRFNTSDAIGEGAPTFFNRSLWMWSEENYLTEHRWPHWMKQEEMTEQYKIDFWNEQVEWWTQFITGGSLPESSYDMISMEQSALIGIIIQYHEKLKNRYLSTEERAFLREKLKNAYMQLFGYGVA